jgi:hypothetical protein
VNGVSPPEALATLIVMFSLARDRHARERSRLSTFEQCLDPICRLTAPLKGSVDVSHP